MLMLSSVSVMFLHQCSGGKKHRHSLGTLSRPELLRGRGLHDEADDMERKRTGWPDMKGMSGTEQIEQHREFMGVREARACRRRVMKTRRKAPTGA